jgi:hypothetical protein
LRSAAASSAEEVRAHAGSGNRDRKQSYWYEFLDHLFFLLMGASRMIPLPNY